MNKKGFVFVESIVVLMVVTLSVAMLIASYSLVSRKTKEKENYDRASDKYLLYAISTMGTDEKCNYATSNNTIAACNGIEFEANKTTCTTKKTGYLMKDCTKVFEEAKISNLYVVPISSNNIPLG